jgi:RNA polymerase sigma factor (TIGR02999 family)
MPLTPTELINEAWHTRLHQGHWQVRDRGEFFAIAARTMRLVLVDMARRRLAEKRNDGEAPVPLDLWNRNQQSNTATPEQIVAMDHILEGLARADPEAARIFEMKHIAGFTLEEIAVIQDLTFRQVRHRWEKASDWLKKRLGY